MITIRSVEDRDIEQLYEYENDPVAIAMAVFGGREHDAFVEHWAKIRRNPENVIRAIELDGQLVGNVTSWSMDGLRYVGYWLGRAFWGRGIATEALKQFLAEDATRPIYALVVVTNPGSQRVLEKAGFTRIERRQSPHDHLEEFVYRLD